MVRLLTEVVYQSLQVGQKILSVVSSSGLFKGMSDKSNVVQLTSVNCETLAKSGAQILKEGGVIGTPTDTVYGIAGDAQNSVAVARIYGIKGRDFRKPIAICVSQISQVYMWGKVTVPHAILEDLLPGPVTLVFERVPILNPKLNPTTNLIGIRIPNEPFILQLAKFHDGPVALTSANPSSAPSTLTTEEFKPLWPFLQCVFDGGCLSQDDQATAIARAGSTVIDLSNEGYFRIIREGSAYKQCIEILRDKYNLLEKLKN